MLSAIFNQQMMSYTDNMRPNMEKVSVVPLWNYFL